MAVMLTEHSLFKSFGRHVFANRHEAHIDEVSTARSTEVGMREAVNHILVIIVARARIPGDHLFRLGAQLHHALRHCRTWKRATAQGACLVGLRADERVDKSRVIVSLRNHQKRQEQS